MIDFKAEKLKLEIRELDKAMKTALVKIGLILLYLTLGLILL